METTVHNIMRNTSNFINLGQYYRAKSMLASTATLHKLNKQVSYQIYSMRKKKTSMPRASKQCLQTCRTHPAADKTTLHKNYSDSSLSLISLISLSTRKGGAGPIA